MEFVAGLCLKAVMVLWVVGDLRKGLVLRWGLQRTDVAPPRILSRHMHYRSCQHVRSLHTRVHVCCMYVCVHVGV